MTTLLLIVAGYVACSLLVCRGLGRLVRDCDEAALRARRARTPESNSKTVEPTLTVGTRHPLEQPGVTVPARQWAEQASTTSTS